MVRNYKRKKPSNKDRPKKITDTALESVTENPRKSSRFVTHSCCVCNKRINTMSINIKCTSCQQRVHQYCIHSNEHASVCFNCYSDNDD